MGPCAGRIGPENCTSGSSRWSNVLLGLQNQRVGNLGNSGMNIQNVARDLIRKLPPALCSQSEKQVAVKVSVSKSVCQLAQVNLPFLHPSSFWRSAYQSGHAWRQCVCQNEELIEQFWSQCGHHPALAEHKVKRIHNFRHRAIPVVLHGDGASVTQNIRSASKSCMFLSWRSLCTPTPQHFLITALWTTMKAQGRIGCSVKSIFRIVYLLSLKICWLKKEDFPIDIFQFYVFPLET